MKKLLLICALIVPLLGCGSHRAAPLALDQIAAEFDKAFQTASPETKSLAQAIARLVERKQYAPASMQLQGMMGNRSLNDAQRSVIARAMAAINQGLQEQVQIQEAAVAAPPRREPKPGSIPVPDAKAVESSAEEAQAVLNIYRATK